MLDLMRLDQWLSWGAVCLIPLSLVGFVLWGHAAESRGALKPPKYPTVSQGNVPWFGGITYSGSDCPQVGSVDNNHEFGEKMTDNEIAALRSGAALWEAARNNKPAARPEVLVKAAGEKEFQYWRKP